MRLALLTGVASLCLVGTVGAQAQTIYSTNSAVAAPNVIATTPGQIVAVPAPPFGPFTPQYIVTPPTVVVAAPREQVIERERVVVEPRQRVIQRERVAGPPQRLVQRERVIAPRERVVERERVIVTPREEIAVAPATGIVTTGSSISGSCFIDLRGIERCY